MLIMKITSTPDTEKRSFITDRLSFITDQATTDHLLTDPTTNRSPTHRPTDPIITDSTEKILFQRLDK